MFFKKLVFPKFQLIEPISQPIEIVIKGLVWVCVFRSVLDCYWISWRYFRSIESNFRSIKNHIESFLKTFVSLVFFIIQTFFKTLILSLFDRSKGQNKIFVVFDQIFFKGFCHLRPVRPLYPSFFIYFHVSCILGRMLNLWKFGDFDNLSLFFHNWLMGFCCGMLLNFSLVFNSINLMNWENFNFLGLESTQFWAFVQLSFNLWNWLVWLIDLVIINYYLSCIMINLVNLLDFWKWFFKFGIVLDINSMLNSILWI